MGARLFGSVVLVVAIQLTDTQVVTRRGTLSKPLIINKLHIIADLNCFSAKFFVNFKLQKILQKKLADKFFCVPCFA